MNVYAIHGRFGAYVQLGETPEKGVEGEPRRSSLTGGLTGVDRDARRSAEAAGAAARAGRASGIGQPIVAGLGRYGPYVKHGDDYRSLEPEDDLFTVGLARALALFAAPKKSGRRRRPSGSSARSR